MMTTRKLRHGFPHQEGHHLNEAARRRAERHIARIDSSGTDHAGEVVALARSPRRLNVYSRCAPCRWRYRKRNSGSDGAFISSSGVLTFRLLSVVRRAWRIKVNFVATRGGRRPDGHRDAPALLALQLHVLVGG